VITLRNPWTTQDRSPKKTETNENKNEAAPLTRSFREDLVGLWNQIRL